ncbi:acetamidase/formamidase family protein [bacterium]|nr:acetamidase/formamidase family protein [bacterium]
MAEHFISRKHSHKLFDPLIEPVVRVDSGDTITFETDYEFYRALATGEREYTVYNEDEPANTVTGPVFINGLEPGDALRIDIMDITMERNWAVWFPKYGGFKTDRLQIREIPIIEGQLQISETIRVALAPMIGCIGLAPAQGVSSAYVPTYPWGGNMDLPELCAGATLYLPVQVRGGLLSLGDLHGAMGRGEPLCVGLEGGGRVTVRVLIEKQLKPVMPRIHLDNTVLCVGMGETMDDARRLAVHQAYEVLTGEWGLAPFEAFSYASACLGLRFGGPAHEIVLAELPRLENR